MEKVLHYIGRNKGILPGVPARDLDYSEVRKYGGYSFLVSTGLYEKIVKEKPKRLKKAEAQQESEQ